MLVAIVTAPGCPASTMISASRSCCFAFRTLCGTPFATSRWASISEISIEIVPTSTGWPFSWRSAMSSATAANFSPFVLKTTSFWSLRIIGTLVGIDTTSSL